MSIPTLPTLDSTLGFLADGYTFVSKRCRQLGTEAFHTRLGGAPWYRVPPQDLRVSPRHFPAGPARGFILSDVHMVQN